MDALLRDLRFGIRMLVKRPGLSLTIIVTFGLGIGLTTTVFSIVNGAMFKGLPVERADRVLLVGRTNPARNFDFMLLDGQDFADFRDQQTVFEGFGALAVRPVNLAEGNGPPERFTGGFFDHHVFELLKVRPVLGRTFGEAEDRPGGDPVVVIGYDLWRDRFGLSRDVLGRTVKAHGITRTIIGVMPKGFAFPDREQLWLPLALAPSARPRGQDQQYFVVGRLKDGVSQAEAQTQMTAIAARLQREYPDANRGLGATVSTFTERVLGGQVFALMMTMLGAVLGVLLIACANVANLLLARASMRTREVAVRTALGAGRAQVIRQLMAEVLVLALAGGVLGFGLGMLGLAWFKAVIAVNPPPFWITFDLDHRVLLFILGATILAGVASSLFPAIQTSKTDIVGALKDEGRGTSGLRMGRFTSGLVIAEVALSCTLLIASGLMIRSVVQLRTVPLPFATENIFTARVNLPDLEYADTAARVRFYDELLPRLAAIPGVEAATLSDGLPASGNGTRVFEVEGQSYATDDDFPLAAEGIVTDGYFETFQTRVVRGRTFTRADRRESQPVAVINESFVRRHFPDGDPIGRRIRMGVRDTTAKWLTVVGVVPDMYMEGIGNNGRSPAGFYIPISQSGVGNTVNLALRTRGAPMSKTTDVRSAVTSIDPNLPIFRVMSMVGVIEDQTWFYRIFGTLFMVFGFAALFLAAIGLYGVMSFSVTRRSHEMGVRMALGAQGRQLVWLVLKKGVVQLGIGLGIGLGLAVLATRPLQFILFGVQARDPAVFGAVVVMLALIGLAASFIPARRVTQVDPVIALGAE
jgi:putative ABC transport system permease protein